MRRVGGWLRSQPGPQTSNKTMTALDEQHILQNALESATLIMNDDLERAESELSQGSSPFHKLGEATAMFLRACLGFEKQVMEQTAKKLAEAEQAATEHQRRAINDPSTTHRSEIYPVGTEYALCHAETQIMSAVIAVLNESLTESLRGFYRLRKAFNTLSEISEAERRYIKSRQRDSKGSSASTIVPAPRSTQQTPSGGSRVAASDVDNDDSDDDLVFVDARDSWSGTTTPAETSGGLAESDFEKLAIDETHHDSSNGYASSAARANGVDANSASAATQAEDEVNFRSVSSDPIDVFIHSGTALCFGLLQLMISMVPPSFAKLLSILSFRGDREAGLRMLWSATNYKESMNGAMAGLVTLGFHNGAIAFCDILSKDALPEARLRNLLTEMRKLYPKSKLWLLEESRMLARGRRLEDAVEIVATGPKSPLKQVEALGMFEMSLNLLYLQRYEECAELFIECVGLNNWSHALYYYIAGICYIELYRLNKTSDPDQAKQYAEKAEKYLLEVPTHAGKKRFMARQLPFDIFVTRKITKWQTRAKTRGSSLVDAVGVSPAVEMIYFWPGFRRMGSERITTCLERLAWSEDAKGNPGWSDEPADERTLLYLLRGVCQRNLGNIEEAQTTLTTHVISQSLQSLKTCPYPDTWSLPAAHYELAVCHWQQAGGEDGDRDLLQKCSDQLAIVERWEAYDLDTRIGLKIATGRQTLKKAGIS